MVSKVENELLTRTSQGTAMGGLLRRYWVPALLAAEIPTAECPPVQVRILGEELVAFRDSQGRIGLLDEHCSHRGTSLFYGRNEECGLRCIYHGWKYDVEGNVLDTPAEPADSRFKEKLRHPAYPTHEVGGMVFAYLGPTDRKPLFPNYEWTSLPVDQTYVTKSLLECNWLQGLEGEVDAAHTSFLHSQFGNGNPDLTFTEVDRVPRYEIETTDFGLRLAAHRAAGPDRTYTRVTTYILPLSCGVAVGSVNAQGALDGHETHFYVPIDERHSWRYDFGFRRTNPITDRDRHRVVQIGPDYRRLRRPDNQYLQDRQLQRIEDFTGIDDFLNEDGCATESMGPIANRTREHLGNADAGVIALRQRLLEAVKLCSAGGDPPHAMIDPEANDYRHAVSTTVVTSGPWREAFPFPNEAPRSTGPIGASSAK